MSYADQVFKVIAENPGISGGDIRRKLNSELGTKFDVRSMNMILNGLKRRKRYSVENRGGSGTSSHWYVVFDEDPTPNPYLDDAQRILRELKRIMPNHRAEWLAEQLQALIESP